ncbi:hypothetical protein EON65_16340, partial [archaeon]
METAAEKEKLNMERKAARLAAGDSDEEEEEEEEEANEEEENRLPSFHPFQVALKDLRSSVVGNISVLVTYPIE